MPLEHKSKKRRIYKTRDLWLYFLRYSGLKKNKGPIPYRLYKEIITSGNEIIMNELINTGKDFLLPFNMGTWKIRKRKFDPDHIYARNYINKELSQKYNKPIYDTHDETNGYYCFIKSKPIRKENILSTYYYVKFNSFWKDRMKMLFKDHMVDYLIK